MKKIFPFIFCLIFSLPFTSSFALIHNVGISNFQFTPASFTANVGDTVKWTLNGGEHTTTSTSVPGGVATWDSGPMSTVGQTFTYVITTTGTYNYECSIHLFTGTFTVSPIGTGIPSISTSSKLVFPNPFTDRVTIQYNQPGSVMIYNVLGNKVADVNLENPNQPVEMNLQNLHPGVYFIALISDGVLVETRKVIKQ